MNHATFLADILKDPASDSPRLAYADWLKKNGDPDRAELIKVQCRRASRPADDPTQAGLEKKEKALLNKHGESWKKDLPEWARRGAKFRRGFVAILSGPLDAFLKESARLVQITPLEGLDLCMNGHDVAAVKALAQCPHAAGFAELDLSYNEVGNEGAKALAASPYLTRLRSLTVGSAGLGNAGLKALAASPGMVGLTYLDIHTNTKINLAGLKALTTAPWKLETLRLGNLSLGADGTALLAGTKMLAGLTHLSVAHCGIDAEGAIALASSPYLTNLRELEMEHNHVTAAGAAALAGSATLANLTELTLGFCELDDEAGLALARSPHFSRIKSLWVHCNRFSEATREEFTRRFGKVVHV